MKTQLENRRILVVDDNPSLHEDFKKILGGNKNETLVRLNESANDLFGTDSKPRPTTKFDCELDFASQGEEALNKVISALATNQPYALIFMDVRMPPGWDGITTIGKIWEKAPLTEIVICTAYSDYSLDDVISKLGMSERLLFLKKPFDSVEVLQIAIAKTKKWNLEQNHIKHTADLERLVQERTKELDETRAKSANGAKLMALGEMAGGIAHEINNPLAIIQANGSLLRDLFDENISKEMGIKLTDKIISTTERIAKIVKGLRAFSRSGDNDPFESTGIEQIIEETLGICREKFKMHNIKIEIINSNPNLQIECRKVQVTQVLLNLLNNAYDAIENLADKWIKMEIKEVSESIEIGITDSGSGLSPQITEKMFQPFFTTKEIGKGTGLGLSISKGIIETHHGKLMLDAKSKNTCFIVSLPKQQTSAEKLAG